MPAKTILIVEDDHSLSGALHAKLTTSSFGTMICDDGADAMEALRAKKFDLILLDIILPRMDGFQILTELPKTLNKHTPVVVLTNLSEQSDVEQAKALGAVECYIKSETSLSIVLEGIKSILGIAPEPPPQEQPHAQA